ncbi:TPA: hypothetical protein I7269_24975 [Vibrio parahaemolyticus]|uniref:Uncharacterized protein n=1 Tax=Vibrio parahaemolyticus TaxID=670 RepID=A0A8H9K4J9_VIBPH|nr:hypothetical protein [Vibrio parahaemolyticus]HAS6680036.1 hypothetical protein [Vibrio parahaemolyticus]
MRENGSSSIRHSKEQSLFDAAEPSTPEGDELERLAALVEEYEEKHFPI